MTGLIIKKLKNKLNTNTVMPIVIMFLNYLTLNPIARSFIKGYHKDKIGVPSLSVRSTSVTDGFSKANTLNNQFASVFTREDISTIPSVSCPLYPDMDNIEIEVNGVANLLTNLDPHCLDFPV